MRDAAGQEHQPEGAVDQTPMARGSEAGRDVQRSLLQEVSDNLTFCSSSTLARLD